MLRYRAQLFNCGAPNRSVFAGVYCETVTEQERHPYPDCHALTFQLGGAPLRRTGGSRCHRGVLTTGTLAIQPAHVASIWSTEGPSKWLQVYLPISMVEECSAAIGHWRNKPLTDIRLNVSDRVLTKQLYRGALALCSSNAPDLLAREEWALELVNLVCTYSAFNGQMDDSWISAHTRLGSTRLRNVREYIQARLSDSLSVSEIANVAGMDRFAFMREFKRASGMSTYKYVMALRADRALSMLANSSESLANIACDCGYSNQSHMTNEITRRYGVSPRMLRTAGRM